VPEAQTAAGAARRGFPAAVRGFNQWAATKAPFWWGWVVALTVLVWPVGLTLFGLNA
jgi:hypothetical protein